MWYVQDVYFTRYSYMIVVTLNFQVSVYFVSWVVTTFRYSCLSLLQTRNPETLNWLQKRFIPCVSKHGPCFFNHTVWKSKGNFRLTNFISRVLLSLLYYQFENVQFFVILEIAYLFILFLQHIKNMARKTIHTATQNIEINTINTSGQCHSSLFLY